MTAFTSLTPGGVIGILGGGQLGRMLGFAAARLGYRVHGYCPDADSPLSQVTDRFTVADYDDERALSRFADEVDLVTFEFENVPAVTVDFLRTRVPVRPNPKALAITQDRLEEKRFLEARAIPVVPYMPVAALEDMAAAVLVTGLPAVLKTRRLGYDGKGQVLIRNGEEMEPGWQSLAGAAAILEKFMDFDRELSIIAARGVNGEIRIYPLIENRHRHHILDTSVAPAQAPDGVIVAARDMAETILNDLDYVGVMAIEWFLKGETLFVNELAPRVHNSGHWTIEGAVTSQFEQHIRAICGLPLGSAEPLFRAEMKNLVGDEVEGWRAYLSEPGTHLHLYGKGAIRPGRKMGHVTRLSPLEDR